MKQNSKYKLSSYKQHRFCVIDSESGKVVDDAGGYGYKTEKTANTALWFRSKTTAQRKRIYLDQKRARKKERIRLQIATGEYPFRNHKIIGFDSDKFAVVDGNNKIVLNNYGKGYLTYYVALEALNKLKKNHQLSQRLISA